MPARGSTLAQSHVGAHLVVVYTPARNPITKAVAVGASKRATTNSYVTVVTLSSCHLWLAVRQSHAITHVLEHPLRVDIRKQHIHATSPKYVHLAHTSPPGLVPAVKTRQSRMSGVHKIECRVVKHVVPSYPAVSTLATNPVIDLENVNPARKYVRNRNGSVDTHAPHNVTLLPNAQRPIRANT